MGANIILYDRIWMNDYIEHLEYQRNLLRGIEHHLQREKAITLPELQMDYVGILLQVKEFGRTLEATEKTLKDYLNNVQGSAMRLQQQCQDIELPAVFTAN